MAQLKSTCEILDIERGGTKESVVTRILEFLLKPASSGKALLADKKRSEFVLWKRKHFRCVWRFWKVTLWNWLFDVRLTAYAARKPIICILLTFSERSSSGKKGKAPRKKGEKGKKDVKKKKPKKKASGDSEEEDSESEEDDDAEEDKDDESDAEGSDDQVPVPSPEAGRFLSQWQVDFVIQLSNGPFSFGRWKNRSPLPTRKKSPKRKLKKMVMMTKTRKRRKKMQKIPRYVLHKTWFCFQGEHWSRIKSFFFHVTAVFAECLQSFVLPEPCAFWSIVGADVAPFITVFELLLGRGTQEEESEDAAVKREKTRESVPKKERYFFSLSRSSSLWPWELHVYAAAFVIFLQLWARCIAEDSDSGSDDDEPLVKQKSPKPPSVCVFPTAFQFCWLFSGFSPPLKILKFLKKWRHPWIPGKTLEFYSESLKNRKHPWKTLPSCQVNFLASQGYGSFAASEEKKLLSWKGIGTPCLQSYFCTVQSSFSVFQ